MLREHAPQVGVAEDVAVEREKRVVELALELLDRTPGAERLLLDHVRELYAEAKAVAEMLADGIGEEAEQYGHVAHVVPREPGEHMLEEGPPQQRRHRLGRAFGQRAQA